MIKRRTSKGMHFAANIRRAGVAALAIASLCLLGAGSAQQDELRETVIVDGIAITPEMMDEALAQLNNVEGYNRDALSEGMLAVTMGAKFGYIDVQGKIVIAPRFDIAHDFAQGKAAVYIGGKWGYIDPKGKTAIALQFEEARDFCGNFAAVKIAGCWGFITLHGNLMIKPLYEDAGPFSEELAAVRFKGKWGYITRLGVMAIAPCFEAADVFSNGLAAVAAPSADPRQVGMKWGFIERSGKMVIAAKFDRVQPFSANGHAYGWWGKWHGEIDKKGRWIGKPSDQPIIYI